MLWLGAILCFIAYLI
jgi:sodium/potassium-transporting ATPase subunit alpha